MDRKIVSDGTKTLIARIGDVEVSRPELITGLFFVGTEKGEDGPDIFTVQFGLQGWEVRDQTGIQRIVHYHEGAEHYPAPGCVECAAWWLVAKLKRRHRRRLAAAEKAAS